MAHVAVIAIECQGDRPGCTKRATREVFGRDRKSRGMFCRSCAEVVRHKTEQEEARSDRRGRKEAATGALPVVTEGES
jgi:hypothetical protein